MTVLLVLALLWGSLPAYADEAGWRALAETGAVALMRHAEAPGTLDPEGFRLDDCATQRLLDHRGRAQARAWGEAIKRSGIRVSRVLTSQWCRCRETAQLLAVAPVEDFPALNSLRWERADREVQAAEVMEVIRSGEKLILVTHAFNISALTGVSPAPGEIVVVGMDRVERLEVRGRIK